MIIRVENIVSDLLPGFKAVVDVYIIQSVNIDIERYKKHIIPSLIPNMGRAYCSEMGVIYKKKATINANWAMEIGFLPEVNDNVAKTVKQIIDDTLKQKTDTIVHSKKLFLGDFPIPSNFGDSFNSLINVLNFYSPIPEYYPVTTDNKENKHYKKRVRNIALDTTENMMKLSENMKLGLSLSSMQAIKTHFNGLGRMPHDIELESIAQTWSEHCKHTIFSSPIDEIKEGLYKHYIKKSTEIICKQKPSLCVSVFDDNAGAISFNKDWLLVAKVETHNSPSALEPFNGALTGILGVNRDIIGFGKSAKPITNSYGFCFAHPNKNHHLYYSKNDPILHPSIIAREVIKGVKTGGNCSGIPTTQGFMIFDDEYIAKPLVYVGTLGIIPRTIKGKLSHIKRIQNGDRIVVVGSRTGKDGIHGANFSSNAISGNDNKSTVQIGDPITQKKLSDAIVHELRDKDLYNSITDNGAGGLSSSVGEMGINGFHVEIEKVKLKYDDIDPWQIWVSESQERMTLAVPREKLHEVESIFTKHDIEVSDIGHFTNDKKAIITHKGKIICNMDTNFLHNGMPKQPLKSTQQKTHYNTTIHRTNSLNLLKDPNFQNCAFIAEQYDHEVQSTSVVKPLQGPGKIFADATAIRPVPSSEECIVQSQSTAIIKDGEDPYMVTAYAIDTAIRNAVVIGGDVNHMALLDNFCWSNPYSEQRLWQLKEAAKACHDCSIQYGTPFVSGKDSMFNDFQGYDQYCNEVKISNVPTLLISSFGVIPNSNHCVSLDAKYAGDLIYIIGHVNTKIDAKQSYSVYETYLSSLKEGLIASAISIREGGVEFALLRTIMSGQLGAKITIEPQLLNDKLSGCMLVTVNPNNKQNMLNHFTKSSILEIGAITENQVLTVNKESPVKLQKITEIYNSKMV